MKYVVPYLRARPMDDSREDERSGKEFTQEMLDEIDELFMRLERFNPPPTFVEGVLISVKLLSHTTPQDDEESGLIARYYSHSPS